MTYFVFYTVPARRAREELALPPGAFKLRLEKYSMIRLKRLNGSAFVLNSDLIKTIEATPDTVITLTTGEKLMVLEPVEEVLRETAAYRRSLNGERPR
jgi:flagellar protein FlbD